MSRGTANKDQACQSGADEACISLSLLLLRWQTSGDTGAFDALVTQARQQVERVAERVLQQHGLRDPAALDDAVSLVLDHLRRLFDPGGGERPVGRFAPAARTAMTKDPGRAFLTCLTRHRALDVARARRRQRSVPFSQLGGELAEVLERRITAAVPTASAAVLIERLLAAAAALEPRQRLLVELLLEGKSQATIAHVLGVCEGTVSRLRERTIAALRARVAD